MPTHLRTSPRTLVILALALAHALAAGCDPADASFDDDDVEFREFDNPPPDPSIAGFVKRPPLYPVQMFDKGHEIPWSSSWINSNYDPHTGAIDDGTGRTRYSFDSNGLLIYGTNDILSAGGACDAFLEDHSAVPISSIGTLDYCVDAEQGCCDYVCKAWGGAPNVQQRVAFVTQDVMDNKDIKMAYVPEFLTWNDSDPAHKGGLGRSKACACNCD